MTGVVRTFLPWYRAGLATGLGDGPAPGTARAGVPATVRMREEPGLAAMTVPVQLAGPGDIIGLDQREVLRTEPFDGSADFEPSYFPYVELASPDLPWRFTPFGPRTQPLPDPEADPTQPAASREQQLLAPWIALVVVRADAAKLSAAPSGGLPVLACDAAELPDPTETWAWAHIQVTHDAAQTVDAALQDRSRRVARLVCPRRLAGGVRYLACVVPTFAAGRAAAVPGAKAADPLAPAWGAGDDVQLPVYVQWSFTTGQEGSFEALVRRLRPYPIPAGFGGRTIATGRPGWGVAAQTPDAAVEMQGALRPLRLAEPVLGDAVLAESLRTAVSRSGPGVELRPPLYGQDHQGGAAALEAGVSGWLAQLNTDPRRRLAAGFAAWAVAVHQEELADAAWRQLARARPADRDAGDAQLAGAVVDSLTARHDVTVAQPALTRLVRAGGPLAGGAVLSRAVAALNELGAGVVTASPVAAEAPTVAGDAPARLTQRFAPHFDDPAYALLRSLAEEWLLPAAGELPGDSVALVQTNAAFVESFLVGLNHALARELIWRRYPLDETGTFFDRFWAAPPGSPSTAVSALADWRPEDDLGTHGAEADHLVLLLRGALLRRFPTAAVYLTRTDAAGAEQRLAPHLSGTIGTDIVFLGFPLTPAQALAADGGADGRSAWSIVVQEALDHARFGCDDPPEAEGEATLGSWQNLDWQHPHVRGRAHVPVAGPLAGVARPVSAGADRTAVWALDSANMAVATQQPAFQVRIPIALWLQPLVAADG